MKILKPLNCVKRSSRHLLSSIRSFRAVRIRLITCLFVHLLFQLGWIGLNWIWSRTNSWRRLAFFDMTFVDASVINAIAYCPTKRNIRMLNFSGIQRTNPANKSGFGVRCRILLPIWHMIQWIVLATLLTYACPIRWAVIRGKLENTNTCTPFKWQRSRTHASAYNTATLSLFPCRNEFVCVCVCESTEKDTKYISP